MKQLNAINQFNLFLTVNQGENLIKVLVFVTPKVNSVYEIHNPSPWNNLTQIGIEFSHFKKTKLGHDIEDCIGQYVTVEIVLKQLTSCFFTLLTLMVKGKTSSIKPSNDDAIFAENQK